MQITSCNEKGSHVDTAVKFCIFKEAMKNYQLIQKYKVQLNKIFETIFQG
jgi:hypothetical protein